MLSKHGSRVQDIVCLLLLAVIVDDDGDENSTFVICLITIISFEVSDLLQTCLKVDTKWCVMNSISPAFTVICPVMLYGQKTTTPTLYIILETK